MKLMQRMSAMVFLGAGVVALADVPETSGPQFFALSVADARTTADWYSRALGVRVHHEFRAPDGGHVILLRGERLSIEIVQVPGAKSPGTEAVKSPHKTHGLFKIGMQVADLDAAVAHLKSLGVKFETQIVEVAQPPLRFVLVRDNEGNFVQLFGEAKRAKKPNRTP
jgi:catechol 2,3-dioxygenase-like lactoylglutathione lyase family enzyme